MISIFLLLCHRYRCRCRRITEVYVCGKRAISWRALTSWLTRAFNHTRSNEGRIEAGDGSRSPPAGTIPWRRSMIRVFALCRALPLGCG